MRNGNSRQLRCGYTTGTCATAATTAALEALLTQESQESVKITLPSGNCVDFVIEECVVTSDTALCGVRKDAGDDPDVTNGLIIRSEVRLMENLAHGEVLFLQGDGVGKVTLSGLGVQVGEPAVNPVPRRMIMNAVGSLLEKFQVEGGVAVTLSVPGGRQVAKKTMNEKVGVVGGLSIIGTSGIVVPYSGEAYLESIRCALQVALHNGCRKVAITSGGRSEKILKKLYPELPDMAFIHYGNRIGETLEMIREYGSFEEVSAGVMLAKATKLAQGELDTSSRNVPVNRDFIADLAEKAGYDRDTCRKVLDVTLIRNITEIIPFGKEEPLYRELSRECYRVCSRLVPGMQLTFVLMNMAGSCVTRNSLEDNPA